MSFQVDLPAGLLQSTMVYPPKNTPQNQEYLITRVWSNFLQQQIVNRLQASPQIVQTVERTALNDTVASTAINIGTVTAGLCRLRFYLRITTPARVADSGTGKFCVTELGVGLPIRGRL